MALHVYILKVAGGAALLMAAGCVSESTGSSPPGWEVRCLNDVTTNQERCAAMTFGAPMGMDGLPYLPPNEPFQVFFVNGRGPFILAGFHDFPGERPLIRFDNDSSAVTVPDDGGVTPALPAPHIVQRMLTSSVARVRSFSWPTGPSDMYVDTTGFAAAWAELQQRIR